MLGVLKNGMGGGEIVNEKVNTLIARTMQMCEEEGASIEEVSEFVQELGWKANEFLKENRKNTPFKYPRGILSPSTSQ